VTHTTKIRIFRKGNGLIQVHPSPAILQGGQTFTIMNTTGEEATVSFGSDSIGPKGATIPARKWADFTARGGVPEYVEYDVRLASGHCAEGSSKPGAIIDP
jgi:hypothetical protein